MNQPKEIEMVTQEQAEELARQHVQEYVNSCGCLTVEDIGNVLLKMLSVTAVSIAATNGKHTAVSMLLGTAGFIEKQPDNWKMSISH
jgi:hypothetical protein